MKCSHLRPRYLSFPGKAGQWTKRTICGKYKFCENFIFYIYNSLFLIFTDVEKLYKIGLRRMEILKYLFVIECTGKNTVFAIISETRLESFLVNNIMYRDIITFFNHIHFSLFKSIFRLKNDSCSTIFCNYRIRFKFSEI